jgi:hypothetical protein
MAPLVNGSRSDYPATVRGFMDACVPEPDSEHIRRWGRQILLRADPEGAARIFEGGIAVIPGAGHVPTMTRPESVVAEIERWAADLAAR